MRTRHIWQTRLMGVMLGLAMLAMPAIAGAACGDGLPDLGEECDPGPDVATDCCTAGCEITSVAPAFVCRPVAGDCDVQETCDGVLPTCPLDSVEGAFVECRAAAGDCDVAENCTGLTATCPADASLPDGTACNDGVTCSTPDACEDGVCTGDPDSDNDNVCNLDDPTDGPLNPIKIQLRLNTVTPPHDNSALKAKGDFVTSPPGDVFSAAAPITLRIGDGSSPTPNARTITWQPANCTSTARRVRCMTPDRFGRALFLTHPRANGVWKFRARFKKQNLQGGLEGPAFATLTYGPSTNRTGTVEDCKQQFINDSGLVCSDTQ